MKTLTKITGTLLALACVLPASAQSFNEWQDPNVTQVNRAPMHTDFFAYSSLEEVEKGMENSQNYLSLNGEWKFNWVKDADQRPTKFWAPDFNDSNWGTMPVPGMWELNGYGDPVYLNFYCALRDENKPRRR